MRGIRLPLQLGTSCVNSLAFAAASFGLAAVIRPLGQYIVGGATGVFGWWLASSVLLIFGAWSIAAVRRRAPSDLLISTDGVEIKGGRHDGFAMGWPEVGIDQWSVRSVAMFATIRAADSDDLVLGEAHTFGETKSFKNVLETLRAIVAQRTPKAASSNVELLLCPQCGSPVAAENASTVRCEHCDHSVAVPERVRALALGAREATRSRNRSARALRALLEQPSAGATTWRLGLLAFPMFAPWVLVLVTFLLREKFSQLTALALLAFAIAVVLAAWFFGHTFTLRRYAVAVLSPLAAVAPPRDGVRPSCRSCGAPLPDPGENVVAVCAYCAADNLLLLDVPQMLRVERAGANAIDDALSARTLARLAMAGAIVAALGALAFAAFSLEIAFRVS